MSRQMRRLSGFLLFVASAAVVALAVAFAGSGFLVERDGVAAAAAWRWGSYVTLAASLVSGAAVALGSRFDSRGVVLALGSMLLRLVALGLAGTATVVVLGVEIRPFLLSVAVSYLALLVVDTWYALSLSR